MGCDHEPLNEFGRWRGIASREKQSGDRLSREKHDHDSQDRGGEQGQCSSGDDGRSVALILVTQIMPRETCDEAGPGDQKQEHDEFPLKGPAYLVDPPASRFPQEPPSMVSNSDAKLLRMPPWSYTWIMVLPAIILFAMFAQPWLKPHDLLVDPVHWIQNRPEFKEDGPPFVLGLISTTGGLIWWTGAVACLFASVLVRSAGRLRSSAYLMSAGAFTGLLGLDDLLLIHDGYLAHFHVPEPLTLGAYGLYLVAHCIVFRREILASENGLLMLGVLGLGGSAGVDVLAPEVRFWGYCEESLKFMGLCAWTAYHCRLAYTLSTAVLMRPAAEAGGSSE